VDLAVAAAFTAAGLSLVNVAITGYQNRRGQLDQWRRDMERPIIATILTFSEEALAPMLEVSSLRSAWIASIPSAGEPADTTALDEYVKKWQIAADILPKLRFQVSQLDLVAGQRLRVIAHQLISEHESIIRWLRPASGASNFERLAIQQNNLIVGLHTDLINTARIDLGVDRTISAKLPGRRARPNGEL
jgi:hypothetical protein